MARGQIEADAPWQAHPYEGQDVPPPDTPVNRDGTCGSCDSGRCDDECNVGTDWLCTFERRGCFWFRGEYLSWWTKSTDMPALATTNSDTTTPYNEAGVLPNATVLYSGTDGDPGMRSGVRLNLGYWFEPCATSGLDITYTVLGNADSTFERTSADNAILAIPYLNIDPTVAAQDAYVIAYPNDPNVRTGSITIRNSQELNFLEALTRWSIVQDCNRRLDFVVGYRYGRFKEALTIDSVTDIASTSNSVQKSDLFDARNEFNGLEFGFISSSRHCRWSLDLLTKLAIGNTHSRVNVNGSTAVTDRGGNVTRYDGGLLALPSNSGSVEQNNLGVIPELGITVGYDLTCNLKFTAGYTFVYWSSVMRPGDQIDTTINGSRVPPIIQASGETLPASKSVTTDFWAQGINAGLSYRY